MKIGEKFDYYADVLERGVRYYSGSKSHMSPCTHTQWGPLGTCSIAVSVGHRPRAHGTETHPNPGAEGGQHLSGHCDRAGRGSLADRPTASHWGYLGLLVETPRSPSLCHFPVGAGGHVCVGQTHVCGVCGLHCAFQPPHMHQIMCVIFLYDNLHVCTQIMYVPDMCVIACMSIFMYSSESCVPQPCILYPFMSTSVHASGPCVSQPCLLCPCMSTFRHVPDYACPSHACYIHSCQPPCTIRSCVLYPCMSPFTHTPDHCYIHCVTLQVHIRSCVLHLCVTLHTH